jgi:hypothetical protein
MIAIAVLVAYITNSCIAHTAGNPCRDPTTGRYTTCGSSSSGDPNAGWYALAGLLGTAAIIGIGLAIAPHIDRANRNSSVTTETPRISNPDSDNDGVPDSVDSCPSLHRETEERGIYRQNWLWGCPRSTMLNNSQNNTLEDSSVDSRTNGPPIYHEP